MVSFHRRLHVDKYSQQTCDYLTQKLAVFWTSTISAKGTNRPIDVNGEQFDVDNRKAHNTLHVLVFIYSSLKDFFLS